MGDINYSQCWEDTQLLMQALNVDHDDVVLSITSGGDNSLALLTHRPAKVYLVDKNPAQNHLAELKLVAPRVVDHEEYRELLGVDASERRSELAARVAPLLTRPAQEWMAANTAMFERGLIHGGKFERYLNRFRRFVLPLVHSSRTITQFIDQSDLPAQVDFYERSWNTWRWRVAFRAATASYVVRRFARQDGSATGAGARGREYAARLDRVLRREVLQTNYYLRYALTGQYGEMVPDYLRPENFGTLRACAADAYEFRHQDLLTFLRSMPDGSISKYNLSDAFEFVPPEGASAVWQEIVRTASQGARVAYWCNQREHVAPVGLPGKVMAEADLAQRLTARDRLYYYRSFHVYTISS